MGVIEWEDELRAFADSAKKELQQINDVELLNKLHGEILGKIGYLETCISRAKEHSGIDVEVGIQSYKNRYDSLKERYDIRENECHDLRTQISELKNKLISLQNEKNIVKKTVRRQSKEKLDSAARKPKILMGGPYPNIGENSSARKISSKKSKSKK